MFITLLGDATAFAGLVFGYFFFWTIHDDFPPALLQADLVQAEVGLGVAWPAAGVALAVAGWALTVLARWGNRRGAIYEARLFIAADAARTTDEPRRGQEW